MISRRPSESAAISAGRRKRIALIGARGIGRHHANWWRAAGAEVCAVLGRTEATAQASAETLREAWGIVAAPYADLHRMLEEQRPDIVDVCSPPEAHADHIEAALRAGCDVLCEKPLYFEETWSAAAMTDRAAALVVLSVRQGRRLALCTQYAVAADEVLRWWREQTDAALPHCLEATLCSPARGRAPCPPRTWIDLGPHLIAVLQAIAPGGTARIESAESEKGGHQARIHLTWEISDGSRILAVLTVNHRETELAHERCLILDGCRFDLAGEKGADGYYAARYQCGGAARVALDPMRRLIQDFLRGHDWLNAEAALANERLLLSIWERLRESV